MSIETDLDELAKSVESPAKAAKAKAEPKTEVRKTVRIILEESDDIPPNGLFIQHNGRPFIIPCGVEVDIPLYLKEILDNAKISVPDVDPTNRRVRGWRERHKYSYRVVNA